MHLPTKKSNNKFWLVIFASAILIIASGIVYAQRRCTIHAGPLTGGGNGFISCNSSAGNYAFACDSDGFCYNDTDPEVQADVDAYCASPDSCANTPAPVESQQ